MLKRCVVLMAGLAWLSAAYVSAHELKVLADRWVAAEGESVRVYLSWGHSLTDDSPVDAETLERYELVTPGGVSGPLKSAGRSVQANQAPLRARGVYHVVASRRPAVLTYVYDEAGERVMRRGPKSSIVDDRIDYAIRSRHSGQALLVAGAASEAAIKPAGLPLEIVPLDGPAAWRVGRAIRFQLRIGGQPAAGRRVLATHAGSEEDAWCLATNTDAQGVATVRVQEAGTWVLLANVLKPTRGPEREEYDFDSNTTTLTLTVLAEQDAPGESPATQQAP